MAITNKDKDYVQVLGRYVGRDNDADAMNKAAYYLALTADEQEYDQVIIWFEEGARNRVRSQWHLDIYLTLLKNLAALMIQKPGYHITEIYGLED